jgi:hypothetical protein
VANKAIGCWRWRLALNSVQIRAFVAKKAVGVGEILNGVAPLGLIGFASFYHFLGLTPEAIDLSRRWR